MELKKIGHCNIDMFAIKNQYTLIKVFVTVACHFYEGYKIDILMLIFLMLIKNKKLNIWTIERKVTIILPTLMPFLSGTGFINILSARAAKSSFNREQGNYSSHKNNCRAK